MAKDSSYDREKTIEGEVSKLCQFLFLLHLKLKSITAPGVLRFGFWYYFRIFNPMTPTIIISKQSIFISSKVSLNRSIPYSETIAVPKAAQT